MALTRINTRCSWRLLALCGAVVLVGLLSLADSRVHVHSPPPARTNPATTEAIEYQLDQAPSLRHALEDVADALGSVYSSVPDRDTSSPRFRSQGYGNADEDRDDVADDTALQRDPSAGAGDSDMLPAGDSFTAQSDDTLTDSDVPSFLSEGEHVRVRVHKPKPKIEATSITQDEKEEKEEIHQEEQIEKASKKLDSPTNLAQDPSDDGKTGSDSQLHDLLTSLDEHDDAEDAIVGSLVKNMVTDSKKKKLKGTKATVVTNSNVLNHKSKGDPDKHINIEERMKHTQEEGVKSIRENEQKDLDEKSQKDKERKAKKAVAKQRESLRKQYHKEADEQNKKEFLEHKEKRNERDEKTTEETANKRKVQEVRMKAREQMEKGRIEMNNKRIHEDKEKLHLEKDNKHKLESARKQGERDRKTMEQQLDQQRQQEEQQKREQMQREQTQKQEWQKAEQEKKTEAKVKEEAKKQEKLQETTNWCECYTQHTHFEVEGRRDWGLCKDGWLVTGFNRGASHFLNNLFYFQCCRPCKPDGQRMSVTNCQSANWWSSFDSKGWSMCPEHTYIQGLWKNDCPYIYCIEEARCCQIEGSRGSRYCNPKESWMTSFDNAGWSNLDENMFMRGLYRSEGQLLYNIEYPFQCAPFAH